MQNDKKSLERREFLKISAKFSAMVSLASLSGFALNACDSKESTNKDFTQDSQNIQGDTMEFVTLNNGIKMPILGYGVFQVEPKETQRCVEDAISVG